ncbi:MAG: photosystem I reaction center subunit XII [Leptolyngbya sp. SIOISBB]|nr:photosystem I reaction center subunit XII [Leptolyngbya sp. SIOISBB]
MALWLEDTDVLELRPNFTEDELQLVIRATYKQVFGNAHLMESQRLTTAESLLRDGNITVKGFVRAIAQSDAYRSLFFETSSPYRFVELNFKHLLGRAPQDQEEIAEHVVLYNEQGYAAEINSYLDNGEYDANFGENLVPSVRGNKTQTGVKNVGFNRTFSLFRGDATSDTGESASLISDVAGNRGTKIVNPARGSGATSSTGKRFRITVAKVTYGPRVTQSNHTFEVGYAQLSKKIQNIQKTGGKILKIAEVATA